MAEAQRTVPASHTTPAGLLQSRYAGLADEARDLVAHGHAGAAELHDIAAMLGVLRRRVRELVLKSPGLEASYAHELDESFKDAISECTMNAERLIYNAILDIEMPDLPAEPTPAPRLATPATQAA